MLGNGAYEKDDLIEIPLKNLPKSLSTLKSLEVVKLSLDNYLSLDESKNFCRDIQLISEIFQSV